VRYIGSILLLLGATSFAIFSEENTFRAKTYVPSPSSVPSPSLKGNYPKVTDIPLIFIGKNEKIKLSEVEDDLRKNKGGDYDPNRVANDTERLLKTGKYSFAKVFASHESIEAGGILIRRAVALQLNKAERKEPHYGDPIIATLNNRSLKLASKKLNAIPVVAEKDQEKDVDDYISLGSLLSETVWKEVELVTDKDQGRLSSDSFNESIAKLRKEAVISLARKKINKKILESSSFQVPDYEYDKEERRVVHEKYGGDWQQLGLTLEAEGKTMLDWKQNVHSALIDARVNKYLSAKGISITTDEIEQCLSFVDNISDYIWGFYPLQNKNISGVVLEVPEYMPDDYLVISTIRGESAFIEKANQDEFIIDKIAIGGNQVIPDAIIRSEVLFAPGESFNPDLIKQICESILGLGLFCCIKASYEETDVQGRKKLVIVVDELDSLKQRNVAEIIVPEGTKEIEPAKYCLFTKAKEIKIPSSVNKIGNKAFAFCRVATNINIPDNIKSIGNMAFYNCNGITDMKLPDSLQEIGYSSFAYCGLTNAVVTQNMTNPVSAYYGCRNLRTYTVSEANTLFSAIDGVLYSKDKTRLIRFPPSYSKGTYIVPKTCTSIEKYSFESAPNLTNLVIPNNVTNVGKDTFYGLTNKGSVVLPEHLFQKNLHHMWIAPDVVRDAAE
jgi:hypothetical protein